ncbi:hypothetical protein ANO14919_109890 [Xylariales sp. No.14919]|nr:hypothetical protein ANO14919_109890 [Xylariales sp. No.14919]
MDSREYAMNLGGFGSIGGAWGAPPAEGTGNLEYMGETEDTNQNESQEPSKPKRKRENRYKNAPPAVISRRREQNRASQRAYRERKDQRIKDLEADLEIERKKVVQLNKGYKEMMGQYAELQRNYEQVVNERDELRKAKDQFWMSQSDTANTWVATGAYNSNALTTATLEDVSNGYNDNNYDGVHYYDDDQRPDFPG